MTTRNTLYRRSASSKAQPWVPSTPMVNAILPPSMNLDALFLPIMDQGSVGNGECFACTMAALFEAMLARSGAAPKERVSRLFPYWNARKQMAPPETGQDNGASNEQMADAMIAFGVCVERLYPFNGSNIRIGPNVVSYADAASRRAVGYRSLHNFWLPDGVTRDILPMKRALANREPFGIGLVDYANLKCSHATTLDIPPREMWHKIAGAHAVVVSGYDDGHVNPAQGEWPQSVGAFKFRNSWGSGWGLAGQGWMPYLFMSNSALAFDQTTLATDFSTIRNAGIR